MRFFATSVALSSLATSAFALLQIQKYSGDISGLHIVTLKDGVSQDTFLDNVGIPEAAVTARWGIINGFAGSFPSDMLTALLANPNVKSVSEDGIMTTYGQRNDAPWGLERISSAKKLDDQVASHKNFKYRYDSDALGHGVDIYIVDTGVNVKHQAFGGRARWGAQCILGSLGNSVDPCIRNSLPTTTSSLVMAHTAHDGTAAGSPYGVAQNASIIAVKVMNGAGLGQTSDIISGLDWVQKEAAQCGRPSVVSMSLGGGASDTLDQAVTALTDKGIHVAVAAGNDNADAADTSPARAPAVVTVDASNITDYRASFSNYGSIVDIFAPGQDVISASNLDTTSTRTLSGTSMATPHIAGLIAYFLGIDHTLSPAQMSDKLKTMCIKDALDDLLKSEINDCCVAELTQGLLCFQLAKGTSNCLAHNDISV